MSNIFFKKHTLYLSSKRSSSSSSAEAEALAFAALTSTSLTSLAYFGAFSVLGIGALGLSTYFIYNYLTKSNYNDQSQSGYKKIIIMIISYLLTFNVLIIIVIITLNSSIIINLKKIKNKINFQIENLIDIFHINIFKINKIILIFIFPLVLICYFFNILDDTMIRVGLINIILLNITIIFGYFNPTLYNLYLKNKDYIIFILLFGSLYGFFSDIFLYNRITYIICILFSSSWIKHNKESVIIEFENSIFQKIGTFFIIVFILNIICKWFLFFKPFLSFIFLTFGELPLKEFKGTPIWKWATASPRNSLIGGTFFIGGLLAYNGASKGLEYYWNTRLLDYDDALKRARAQDRINND